MNALARWGRFNLVGAMGMAVQLMAVAVLDSWIAGDHAILISALALEITLLHNFLWHWRFTWRRSNVSPLRALARFQLSNGTVSLLGNAVIVRLAPHDGHWKLLAANLAAIVCCSLANFCLAHRWAFSSQSDSRTL